MAEAGGAPLQLSAVIGFRGEVENGLILHPNDQHVVYSLGSTVIVRDVINCKQEFLTGHDNVINALQLSPSGQWIASGNFVFLKNIFFDFCF